MPEEKTKIKVFPCSGIGKVLGLLARETALETLRLCPQEAETACLARLVTGDEADRVDIKGKPCVTIDGCPALCAASSVTYAEGDLRESYRMMDEMRNHRGVKAGTGSELTEGGWRIVDEFAKKIAARVRGLSEEE